MFAGEQPPGAHAHHCLMCAPRSARTPADRRSRPPSGEPGRAPRGEAIDGRPGTQGPPEFLQLDDPLEPGLEIPVLFERAVIPLEDRALDPGDLAAGPLSGLGQAGGVGCSGPFGPVLEDRPGALQLPHGADDGHDPDGSAPLPQSLPEAAVPSAPGAERLGALVSRIDEDEDGPLGVQGDRQLDREAGVSLRKYLWYNDLVIPSEVRGITWCVRRLKSCFPLGLRQKPERSGRSEAPIPPPQRPSERRSQVPRRRESAVRAVSRPREAERRLSEAVRADFSALGDPVKTRGDWQRRGTDPRLVRGPGESGGHCRRLAMPIRYRPQTPQTLRVPSTIRRDPQPSSPSGRQRA